MKAISSVMQAVCCGFSGVMVLRDAFDWISPPPIDVLIGVTLLVLSLGLLLVAKWETAK